MVFASDSRLRGGEAWDCCPKILILPRSDCAIAFAGQTWWAYPLMLQMAKAIELYPGSMQRRTEIKDVRRHSLQVFKQMLGLISDLPVGAAQPERPDTEFLFGGYSWRDASFRLWRLHFDPHLDRYTFAPTKIWLGQGEDQKMVAFAGDVAPEAAERLRGLLRERGKQASGGLDMEPFEVLRDMIRSQDFPTVGGAPQVAKIYRFMRTQDFGVHWPDRTGQVHVAGRPALPYEVFDAPVIDPDVPHKHFRMSPDTE